MSEKTPTERAEAQAERSERLNSGREQNSWIALLDARARKAGAAEAFAEFAAIHHETGATEDVYEAAERLLREYVAAREAVRKLEAGLSNDDNS